MARWVDGKGFHPENIIQKLNTITSFSSMDNKFHIDYGYPDYSYNGLVVVLANMLHLSSEVSEVKKFDLLQQAIRLTRQEGDITAVKLLGQLRKAENQYIEQPKHDFILATFISADAWFTQPKLENRRIYNATITFGHKLPEKFQSTHNKIREHAKRTIPGKFPDRYQAVRVRVSARTATEAAESALDRLDLLRAIWNFSITRNSSLHPRTTSGIRKPINALVLGPLQTIHKPNGEEVSDETQWWYEPSYIAPITPFDVERNSERMYKDEKWVRERLSRLPYQINLENIFVRYVHALDDTNWKNTFLALWSILEELTNTTGNYEQTIKRTAFLYEDTAYHMEILNHLRRHRNDLIHEGSSTIFFETLSYQAIYYVNQLLEFHLVNHFKFESLGAVADFLGHAIDKDKLKMSFQLLKKVVKFRKVKL